MALRGAVTSRARRSDPSSIKLFVPTNVVLDDADAAVVENFERSLRSLEATGVEVRRGDFAALTAILELTERHGSLIAADAYTEYHGIADGEEGKLIDRRVLFRMLGGKRMSARDVLTIQRRRAELIPQAAARLDGAFLAMPTTPITAPAIAPLEANDEIFYKTNNRTLRNTSLGNVLDMCGVALPNGREGDGMPTSFLLSAPWGEDERLLSAALAVERIVCEPFKPLA
jgi:aspartyl-tRNA(Asn)/glutamyl-tRNA(Gln) amidotransferase subunit A